MKDRKHFQIILLILFLGVNTSFAGLVDLYTGSSKILYEFVQNKSCNDLNKSRANERDIVTCRGDCEKKKDLAKDFNQFAEHTFFQHAASEERNNLICAIQRVGAIKKNQVANEKVKNDILEKLPTLSILNRELKDAKFQYLHLQAKANAMRSGASSSKENQIAYHTVLKKSLEEEQRAKKIFTSQEAILNSIWFGNTQTMRLMLREIYEKDFKSTNYEIIKFEKDFPSLVNNILTELQSNKSNLEKQGRIEKEQLVFDKLDLKMHSLLASNPYYFQSYAEKTNYSALQLAQLQCHLEGKFGKGIEYLDNAIMGASLLLSGGGALLSKTPLLFSSVMGKAANMGEITFMSSRVLTAAGAGLTAHLVLEDFDRKCLSATKSLSNKNICALNEKEQSVAEMMQLEEGNCALSVAIDGLSLMAIVPSLKNIYKGPLNATKAPLRPQVLTIDEYEKILNLDPAQKLTYRLDIDIIRAKSGRLAEKYVKKNPSLKGSLRDAFEGPIEQMTFKPGQVIWQIQRSNQVDSGRWFSTNVAKSRDEAEKLFNVEAWGNDRGQLRMFIVKDEFTGYVGKVAGGKGNQLFIPENVPIADVAVPISFRITPGGEIVKDVKNIPKGTLIEVTWQNRDGTEEIMQGRFSSFKNPAPGKKKSILTFEDLLYPNVFSKPFSDADKLTIRKLPDFVKKGRIPTPRSWNERLVSKSKNNISNLIIGDEIKIKAIEKNAEGVLVKRTFTGEYAGSQGDYIAIKRSQDIAPIFVSKYDIPNQEALIIKESGTVFMPIATNDPKWNFVDVNPAVEINYINNQGKNEKIKGFLQQRASASYDSVWIRTGKEDIKIPIKSVIGKSVRLIRNNEK